MQYPTYDYHQERIVNVFRDRDMFDTYPPCQRDYVWNVPMKAKLIDSILRGLPIPAITVLSAGDTILGERLWIVDGQQRLKTILSFMDNKFTAGSGRSGARGVDEPNLTFIEAGKYFNQLSSPARKQFENYPLQLCYLRNMNPEWTGLVYRRINQQIKLSPAEVLFSYQKAPRLVYDALAGHMFWREFYTGKNDRKQDFSIILSIILMETQHNFANLTTPRLLDVASGTKDDEINPDLIERIRTNMDRCCFLFDNSYVNSIRSVIPIYQAVLLLENENVNFALSRKGALTPWFMRLHEDIVKQRHTLGIGENGDIFTLLTRVNKQYSFWAEELSKIKAMDGLVFKDLKRKFTYQDKIVAWNNQHGKCTYCGRDVRITDQAHHIEAHATGGSTSVSNLVLVHKECHQQLHNGTQASF